MILVAISLKVNSVFLISIFVSLCFVSFILHLIFRPFDTLVQNITALILEFTLICLGFSALAHEFMPLGLITSTKLSLGISYTIIGF